MQRRRWIVVSGVNGRSELRRYFQDITVNFIVFVNVMGAKKSRKHASAVFFSFSPSLCFTSLQGALNAVGGCYYF